MRDNDQTQLVMPDVSAGLSLPAYGASVNTQNLSNNNQSEHATLLSRKRDYLRNKHLIPMVREGQLRFRYPESAKHPHQAYIAGNVFMHMGEGSRQ